MYCIIYIKNLRSALMLKMLNFPKCVRQNQIRQSFSCSLTYQKIPRHNQLVPSAANTFKLMT